MRGHRDLRLILALTLVCAGVSLITALGPVRVIFAAPLALLLPGYAVTAAAFGSRLPAWPARLPLTLGVSLACLVFGGLVLNYTPEGIRGLPWALLLVLVVLVGCLVAARRREPARPGPSPILGLRPSLGTTLLGAGSLVLVGVALIVAQRTVGNDQAFGYTQLWVAPSRPGDTTAQVGVKSDQQESRNYRLQIEVEGRSTPIVRSFELGSGQTKVVSVPAGRTASPIRLIAKLYLRKYPGTPYRQVSTWLQGGPAL